jgi:hypothetical protein
MNAEIDAFNKISNIKTQIYEGFTYFANKTESENTRQLDHDKATLPVETIKKLTSKFNPLFMK